ncbi:hypothetical protein C7T35_34105 [Variovorax sp. WS11]|uniref:transcriptional repressor n=1 Tax=Variovorax sp. WS11 TaxID=1105204 RepID=UPI000D0D1F4E|nr:transcriptional repressor [Variovorax sp. WS11]NDZ18039.1 hypothetical protein [Variovorax sp. WS11]PSL80080.1 hypothetical protein C7T35_34105 [Variovorax sp. WS11]
MSGLSAPTPAAVRPEFPPQLRSAGIPPTLTRLRVLQTLADGGVEWQRREEVFRRMHLRGMAASATSVYRAIRDLKRAGLLEQKQVRGRGRPLAVFRYRQEAGDAEFGGGRLHGDTGRPPMQMQLQGSR